MRDNQFRRLEKPQRIIPGALILASFQSAISELQALAWSCLAEPSLWQDARRERVSFCCRVLPCDGASQLPGQRPLSRTLHTHRKWTGFFQSAMLDQNPMIRRDCRCRWMRSALVFSSVFHCTMLTRFFSPVISLVRSHNRLPAEWKVARAYPLRLPNTSN